MFYNSNEGELQFTIWLNKDFLEQNVTYAQCSAPKKDQKQIWIYFI